jgi:hypothetical protein
MTRRKVLIIFSAAFFVAGIAAGASPAFAQATFQNYRCADGTQFIVGFYQYDPRAHLQVDGGAVTLARRLAVSGSRLFRPRRHLKDHESGHHAQARQTPGDGVRTDMKKGRNVFVSTLFPFLMSHQSPIMHWHRGC